MDLATTTYRTICANLRKYEGREEPKEEFPLTIYNPDFRIHFVHWDVEGYTPRDIDRILKTILGSLTTKTVDVIWSSSMTIGGATIYNTIFPQYGDSLPLDLRNVGVCFYPGNARFGQSINMKIDNIGGTERTIFRMILYKLMRDVYDSKPKELHPDKGLEVQLPLVQQQFYTLKYSGNEWTKVSVQIIKKNGDMIDVSPTELLNSTFMKLKWKTRIICSLKNIVTTATGPFKLKLQVNRIEISEKRILQL